MALPRQVKPLIEYDGSQLTPAATEGEAVAAASTYTVAKGDTLWGIAKKKLGKGSEYTKIYDANADTIEAAAKSHGKKSSDHGHWIYPGTVLNIPGAQAPKETPS